MEQVASRRAVIAGASLVAGALATAAWWRGGVAATRADMVPVVPGREAPPLTVGTATAPDLAQLVGQSIRIAGEAGAATATIAAAQLLPVHGARPAGVRLAPFMLTFLCDRLGAPAGDAIYNIGVTVDGLDRLFLIRGADRGNQAALLAIFN
jgi:hypothetical protein